MESQAAFARRIEVSKQRVGQFIRDRKLDGSALVKNGRSTMIDVEEALSQLKRRLDPDQRISGNARAKLNREPSETEGLGYLSPMASYYDPAHRGAVAMGLYLVHMAGAAAALAAIEIRAPVRVAYRLREITTVHTMELVEMFMVDLGIPTEPSLARVAWPRTRRHVLPRRSAADRGAPGLEGAGPAAVTWAGRARRAERSRHHGQARCPRPSHLDAHAAAASSMTV